MMLYWCCRSTWRTLRFLAVVGFDLAVLLVAFLIGLTYAVMTLTADGYQWIRNRRQPSHPDYDHIADMEHDIGMDGN